jgi:hypothetical protein
VLEGKCPHREIAQPTLKKRLPELFAPISPSIDENAAQFRCRRNCSREIAFQTMKSVQEPVDQNHNLLDFDRKGLAAFFVELGENLFATQL